MPKDIYLKHLDADERTVLESHLKAARRFRGEANVHARWAKQIIDRARARMKAKEKGNV